MGRVAPGLNSVNHCEMGLSRVFGETQAERCERAGTRALTVPNALFRFASSLVIVPTTACIWF